jgi:hypothetical protein
MDELHGPGAAPFASEPSAIVETRLSVPQRKAVQAVAWPSEMNAGPSHEPRSARGRDLLSGTPAEMPPAPWRSSVDALLWLHPATPAARALLPPQLAARAGIPVTIGGLISYRDGPVGPYGEVFGAPIMLRGAPLLSHIPFMAVDSAASVAGGRGNWALPKQLADFDGDPGQPGAVTARGDSWELRITTTARPRRLPMTMTTMLAAQVWADGHVRTFSVRMRGQARLARVKVEHLAASPLGDWLVEGRHLAVLVSGRQDVSPPSP